MSNHTTNEIPYGYCHCGCGQKTNIANQKHAKLGRKKGEPSRFIRGHGAHKYPLTEEPNPSGLCMCGCGGKTKIARQSDTKSGCIKGKPVRYIPNHQFMGTPPENRFWKRVDKRGPDECWLWTGSKYTSGYGQFSIGHRKIAAHRFSYELHNGALPDGLFALHRCDVRACVNPNHLWAGTKKENSCDMVEKGRCKVQNSETHFKAQLTNEQVKEIRELYEKGSRTQAQLSEKYGVSFSIIHGIVHRRTWNHI